MMIEGLGFLISGTILGLAAGISPGPLFALVFSETLKYGKKEGIKIAIAPLITDLPIIFFVLFILSRLTQYNPIIGVITLFGAGYLIYLGVENLKVKSEESEIKLKKKDALKRGVIANFSSPHPYLFWLSIGGPIVIEGWRISIFTAIFFILGFYFFLVGSKILIAFTLEKSKFFIGTGYYLYIVRALGIVLILFALIFLRDGLRSIGLF